uniref:Uncharacterized protein n=1 Tax=Tanacetum cinerariifolium TaxID=118510 RepID=A0A699IPD5_TANCI|nr:hypothetical protein [Tanacetum cinerariifolium]
MNIDFLIYKKRKGGGVLELIVADNFSSSPLTQTGLTDFFPGRAVVDAAHRKCADVGYGFLPFSFSSFGEFKKDAVTLLNRIRKFSVVQDIEDLKKPLTVFL